MNENELAAEAAGQAQNFQEAAQETAQGIKAKAQDFTRRAATGIRETAIATDGYVRDHLWTTVAVVAVTAGLIGFLIGRRS